MTIFELLIGLIAPHRCLGCGVDNFLVCKACASIKMSKLDISDSQRVLAVYQYSDLAAELVKALKFDRVSYASRVMAEHMDADLPDIDCEMVTFVPTAPKRVRLRGYDQARLLAREFAKCRGLPIYSLLSRVKYTRQVGSSRQSRKKQISGAFMAKNSSFGARVLLIDDVMTTGATISEARKTLESAGHKVTCAVFAAKT